MATIHVEQGDLTTYRTDAIVNAANNDLILGGGLAGAISRAGGPEIQAECTAHGPIAVGQAAITTAGDLPARYVIHQASMSLGGRTTAESLRQSTKAALDLADSKGLKTVAFPATGTGIAGFDMRKCAEIMLEAISHHLAGQTTLTDVYVVLVDARTKGIFEEAKRRLSV
jgi:O-acetyl-ADP-ribose deacetylase (regulator of RNase III)